MSVLYAVVMQKRMERGFEPAIDMYSSLDVFVHSPFYKKEGYKAVFKEQNCKDHKLRMYWV